METMQFTISPSSIRYPHLHPLLPQFKPLQTPKPIKFPKLNINTRCSLDSSCDHVQNLVNKFNPKIPIEEALTPPSSWYTDPCFYTHELQQVFHKGWIAIGITEQIKDPRQYFTGRLGNIEYVACRDENGILRAFHNVCRHHASLIASGSGINACFVCPYHGWTYGLDGALLKPTRITGIRNFKLSEMGLVPLGIATWGPFVLLNFESDCAFDENEWLGSTADILKAGGVDSSLSYICRREYIINCNWKVFCDNYLDGGYHVPYAHKDLASGLALNLYSTDVFEKVSIQGCHGSSGQNDEEIDRLGSKALYAFIYPNFMINRYGPWMDTNLVLPLGPQKCRVIFDYFLDFSQKDNEDFIAASLKESEKVQIEDIFLCESVQKGLESPAYCSGRYAPRVEQAMYHFHGLLYESLRNC